MVGQNYGNVSPAARTRKTIRIEIEESDSGPDDFQGPHREMSPAYRNNNSFVKAAKKMGAVGVETKWPRPDNYFMSK